MTLTTSFQKIGEGTSQIFGAATGYLELWAKYNSQSTSGNKSNVTVELRLVVSGGYIGNYQSTPWTISGSLSNSGDIGSGSHRSQTLGSATGDITHNSDGTKSVSFSGTFNATAWGQSLTVSGSADLPKINRYAKFKSNSISGTTEHTVSVSWTADVACDKVQYKVDNGAWTNTSGNTYTIPDLQPGTTYSIKTKIRRTDSQLWTESDALSATTKDCVFKEKISGTWKSCVPYIKVNGTWKKAIPYIKVNGSWKEGIN